MQKSKNVTVSKVFFFFTKGSTNRTYQKAYIEFHIRGTFHKPLSIKQPKGHTMQVIKTMLISSKQFKETNSRLEDGTAAQIGHCKDHEVGSMPF
jgi:hypothetical protein